MGEAPPMRRPPGPCWSRGLCLRSAVSCRWTLPQPPRGKLAQAASALSLTGLFFLSIRNMKNPHQTITSGEDANCETQLSSECKRSLVSEPGFAPQPGTAHTSRSLSDVAAGASPASSPCTTVPRSSARPGVFPWVVRGTELRATRGSELTAAYWGQSL